MTKSTCSEDYEFDLCSISRSLSTFTLSNMPTTSFTSSVDKDSIYEISTKLYNDCKDEKTMKVQIDRIISYMNNMDKTLSEDNVDTLRLLYRERYSDRKFGLDIDELCNLLRSWYDHACYNQEFHDENVRSICVMCHEEYTHSTDLSRNNTDAYEEHMNKLKYQNKKLTENVDFLKAQCDGFEDSSTRMTKDLETCRSQIENLRKQLGTYENVGSENNELKKLVSNLESANESMKQSLGNCQNESKQLTASVEFYKLQCEELNEKFNNNQDFIDKLNETINEKNRLQNLCESLRTEYERDMNKIKQEAEKFQLLNDELIEINQLLEDENRNNMLKIDEVNCQLTNLNQTINQYELGSIVSTSVNEQNQIDIELANRHIKNRRNSEQTNEANVFTEISLTHLKEFDEPLKLIEQLEQQKFAFDDRIVDEKILDHIQTIKTTLGVIIKLKDFLINIRMVYESYINQNSVVNTDVLFLRQPTNIESSNDTEPIFDTDILPSIDQNGMKSHLKLTNQQLHMDVYSNYTPNRFPLYYFDMLSEPFKCSVNESKEKSFENGNDVKFELLSEPQMTRASSLPNITDSGDSGFAQQSSFDSTSVDNKYNEPIQLLNQNIKCKHFRHSRRSCTIPIPKAMASNRLYKKLVDDENCFIRNQSNPSHTMPIVSQTAMSQVARKLNRCDNRKMSMVSSILSDDSSTVIDQKLNKIVTETDSLKSLEQKFNEIVIASNFDNKYLENSIQVYKERHDKLDSTIHLLFENLEAILNKIYVLINEEEHMQGQESKCNWKTSFNECFRSINHTVSNIKTNVTSLISTSSVSSALKQEAHLSELVQLTKSYTTELRKHVKLQKKVSSKSKSKLEKRNRSRTLENQLDMFTEKRPNINEEIIQKEHHQTNVDSLEHTNRRLDMATRKSKQTIPVRESKIFEFFSKINSVQFIRKTMSTVLVLFAMTVLILGILCEKDVFEDIILCLFRNIEINNKGPIPY